MVVIWSAKAKITYFNVLDYLNKNWSRKEMIRFHHRTETILNVIKKNPGIFPYTVKQREIRKAHIDKNNSLFYHVDKQSQRITLLTFFDNRQNPAKLKFD